jgi:hypothetical protein
LVPMLRCLAELCLNYFWFLSCCPEVCLGTTFGPPCISFVHSSSSIWVLEPSLFLGSKAQMLAELCLNYFWFLSCCPEVCLGLGTTYHLWATLHILCSLFRQHLGLGTLFVPWFQGSDVSGTLSELFFAFFCCP